MTENVTKNVTLTLTPKQRRALAELASGATWADAAQAAGVTMRTMHRWRNHPAFVAAMRRVTRGALHDAARRLMGNAETAVDALIELAGGGDDDDDIAEGVRLRAADLLLTYAVRLQELADFAERLDVLEAALANVD